MDKLQTEDSWLLNYRSIWEDEKAQSICYGEYASVIWHRYREVSTINSNWGFGGMVHRSHLMSKCQFVEHCLTVGLNTSCKVRSKQIQAPQLMQLLLKHVIRFLKLNPNFQVCTMYGFIGRLLVVGSGGTGK